jgi:hypothetical protein
MPAGPGAAVRRLLQDIYLQEMVVSLYRVYAGRLRDAGGRGLIETYLEAESDRRRRVLAYLFGQGVSASPAVRSLFAAVGSAYGRVTSCLGTRVMLRIALSASRGASKQACARLGDPAGPDVVFLSTLRARNEGELLDGLMQHLIDTAPRRT